MEGSVQASSGLWAVKASLPVNEVDGLWLGNAPMVEVERQYLAPAIFYVLRTDRGSTKPAWAWFADFPLSWAIN